MKKILILLFYFTSCVSLCAQVNKSKIGYYFDIEGESIEEFYDLDYEPKKSLERIFNVGAEFTPGYFYSSDGRKSDGFIKYLQNNLDFKFKASLQDKPTTINASQCLGFVIGIDSFATINCEWNQYHFFQIEKLIAFFLMRPVLLVLKYPH